MSRFPGFGLAVTPQAPEVYKARVTEVLLSDKFKQMVDEVGRHTEITGREAGMAAYGYNSGDVNIRHEMPVNGDEESPFEYITEEDHYEGYIDRAGLWTNVYTGELYDDLLLHAHTHPVHATSLDYEELPSDVLMPSGFDLETWGKAANWETTTISVHPRLLYGILVRRREFNKMLLLKKSEKRPWVPRHIQHEGEQRGANFMHKVLRSSGLVLATVDFSLDINDYTDQIKSVAETLAEIEH